MVALSDNKSPEENATHAQNCRNALNELRSQLTNFQKGCGDEPALANCKDLAGQILSEIEKGFSLLDQMDASPSGDTAAAIKDYIVNNLKLLMDTLWFKWSDVLE